MSNPFAVYLITDLYHGFIIALSTNISIQYIIFLYIFQNYLYFRKLFLTRLSGRGRYGYGEHGNENISRGTYNSLDNRILTDGLICMKRCRANLAIQTYEDTCYRQWNRNAYGEAKFLRSLFYFYLTDFFGGVPIYDEKTIVSEDFANMLNPRSSIDEVRKFILKIWMTPSQPSLPTEAVMRKAASHRMAPMHSRVRFFSMPNDMPRQLQCLKKLSTVKSIPYIQVTRIYLNLVVTKSSEMIFAVQNLGV